ncbi:hypothetical protein LY76DRAFT_650210 [Colletotrichum caudatum]|nr:hypothetical protein LY76DRAFT_650210 [Colletotrichum caudatum]
MQIGPILKATRRDPGGLDLQSDRRGFSRLSTLPAEAAGADERDQACLLSRRRNEHASSERMGRGVVMPLAFLLVFSGNQATIVQVYGPSLDASLSLGQTKEAEREWGAFHTLTDPPVADSSDLNATGSPSKKWGSSRLRHPLWW